MRLVLSDKFNYFISGSAYDQEGIALGSDFKRYAFRTNLEARITSWAKIGTNTSFSYEDMEEADAGAYTTVTPISASRFMLPYWNPYKKDGSIASLADGTWLGTNQNPLEWYENNPRKVNKAKLIASAFIELRPIQDLVIRSIGGVDFLDRRVDMESTPSYLPNYGSGSFGRSFSRATNLTWTNTANYIKSINGVHNINALIGQETVRNESEGFSATAIGQTNDKLMSMAAGTSVDHGTIFMRHRLICLCLPVVNITTRINTMQTYRYVATVLRNSVKIRVGLHSGRSVPCGTQKPSRSWRMLPG